jgi:Chaperone of endosialidase
MKHTRRIAALLAVFCIPVGLIAQVTGSGTTNHIPKWTGSTSLGNSNIVESVGSACRAAHGGGASQCVGIGTSNPTGTLQIVGGEGASLILESSVANGNPAITVQANTPAGAAAVTINRADGGAGAYLILGTAATEEWRVQIPVGNTEELDIAYGSALPFVTFLQTGQMGIGTQTPANTLEIVAGGTTLADAWTTRSSRQFKTNVQPLEDALQKVEQLQGVSYDRKTDGKHEIGVVAEDVDQVVPEVVSHDPKTHEAQGVDYSRLAALLIEAVKSQQSEIQTQQAEIQQLKAQIGQSTSNAAGQ